MQPHPKSSPIHAAAEPLPLDALLPAAGAMTALGLMILLLIFAV